MTKWSQVEFYYVSFGRCILIANVVCYYPKQKFYRNFLSCNEHGNLFLKNKDSNANGSITFHYVWKCIILWFKGDKNNGFDVLYHNMKHGVVASKELAEFLKERSAIEENNYKLLSKVAKQAGNNTGAQGTFAPVWAALRGAADKLADLHLQMAQRVAELIKDVTKYADELHKKHKAVRNTFFVLSKVQLS